MRNQICPCHSGKPYTICCGPFHKGKIHAPTAEALMRSRYSAYVFNETQYIYRTWDKGNRPPLKVLREDNSQIFTQLEIINCDDGLEHNDSGTVEFIASYKITGSSEHNNTEELFKHHEVSYFLKQKNKWIYVNELSKVKIDVTENKT